MTISNAITYRMPVGFQGAISRDPAQATIEPQIYDTDHMPTQFGIPVKYVSGKVRPIAATDVVANVAQGILVRPYPIQGAINEVMGTATPNPAQIADVMKRGYITVKVNASLPSAVPAKGGQVYVRKTDHGAGEYPIGGIESDADAAKCEALPGAYFTGPMDSNGYCEIAYNL